MAEGWRGRGYCRNHGRYCYGYGRVTIPGNRSGVVLGRDVRDGYFQVKHVRPKKLLPAFHERAGAVVVAATEQVVNPFVAWMGPEVRNRGLYSVFTPAAADVQMMSVAAARAGYFDHGRSISGTAGVYNPTRDSWGITFHARTNREGKRLWQYQRGWTVRLDNLRETDWDGVLIPVSRAWSGRVHAWQNRSGAAGRGGYEVGRWLGHSAGAIMDELWSRAEWHDVNGGGVSRGMRSFSGPFALPGAGRQVSVREVALQLTH